MTYILPPDLYEDWKNLYFAKELLENIVKELKDSENIKRMMEGERSDA